MNSTKKSITDLNVDSEIDLTFERLKRSNYKTLQKELLDKYGRLYEVRVDESIWFPSGALDVIHKHGWTVEDLLSKVQEIYDQK